MGIEQRLNEQLKQAMKGRDQAKLSLIRMVKAKMTERRTQKGFSGEVDDALWVDVISSYEKSLRKGIAEFLKIDSPAATEQIKQLEWEIAELQQYLPQKADEATTRAWVDEAIERLGGREKAKLGAVMGLVMKAHKGEADAGLVRGAVESALA